MKDSLVIILQYVFSLPYSIRIKSVRVNILRINETGLAVMLSRQRC
jgi:hypothetical protein